MTPKGQWTCCTPGERDFLIHTPAIEITQRGDIPQEKGEISILTVSDKLCFGLWRTSGTARIDLCAHASSKESWSLEVMLLKNQSATRVNGSRGVVTGFREKMEGQELVKLPLVRWTNSEETVVEKEKDEKVRCASCAAVFHTPHHRIRTESYTPYLG